METRWHQSVLKVPSESPSQLRSKLAHTQRAYVVGTSRVNKRYGFLREAASIIISYIFTIRQWLFCAYALAV